MRIEARVKARERTRRCELLYGPVRHVGHVYQGHSCFISFNLSFSDWKATEFYNISHDKLTSYDFFQIIMSNSHSIS